MDYNQLPMGVLLPWLKNGGPREIWARSEALIETFIKKNNVKAVSREVLDQMAPVSGVIIVESKYFRSFAEGMSSNAISESAANLAATQKKPVKLGPPPFPGGIKGPHLHFKGNVYMLNERQWKDFSSGIMNDIRKKLDEGNSIPFEPFMELTDAVQSLG